MTDTFTPAQERYTDDALFGLEVCEFDTEPFTHAELDVIDRYHEAIAGTPDCFDTESRGGELIVPDEFTQLETLGMIQSFFSLLDEWHEHIVVLEENLRRIGLSTAAHRYLASQLLSWAESREGYRAAVINHFLGRDKYGYRFDHPRPPQGYRVVDDMVWLG